MKTKHLLTALSAVVLALGIALAGIWYNAQLPPLEPGTAASGQDAEVLFQEWAGAFPDEGSDVRTIRTTLQWMAITVFCTLAATVLGAAPLQAAAGAGIFPALSRHPHRLGSYGHPLAGAGQRYGAVSAAGVFFSHGAGPHLA